MIKIYRKYKKLDFEKMLKKALQEGNDKYKEASKRNDRFVRNYTFKLKKKEVRQDGGDKDKSVSKNS